MTFVSLPTAGQSLGQTRDQIRTNMDDLRSNDAVNHYDTNDANRGKHKNSVYVAQGSTPTTAASEGAAYTKLVNSKTLPFYVKDNLPLVQWPLLPIRAFARFTTPAAPGACTIVGTALNISSASLVTFGQVRINFSEAFFNTNYVCIFNQTALSLPSGGSQPTYNIDYQTTHCFIQSNAAVAANSSFTVMFLYYEV